LLPLGDFRAIAGDLGLLDASSHLPETNRNSFLPQKSAGLV
jgi:hypothetical protein